MSYPNESDSLLPKIEEGTPLSQPSSGNTDDHRQPDELDALLQRTGDIPARQPKKTTPRKKAASDFFPQKQKQEQQKQGFHRKNKSSISELYQAIREYDLDAMRADFLSVSKEVKSQFMHELEEMDHGDEVPFFDMHMTRALSVMPDNIHELAMETAGIQSDELPEGPKVLQSQFFQYMTLLGAVIAVSSVSSAFHFLDNVQAPLKQYWRMTANSWSLFPFAVYHFRKEGIPRLSFGQWLTFLAAIICYSSQCTLYVKSLEYTTVGNATIYANSQALLLILGKALVGQHVHWMEAVGAVIAFGGAGLCTIDAEGQSESKQNLSVPLAHGKLGDALALLSAVPGVLYITFAKSVRSKVPVTVFIFGVMIIGQLLILGFLVLTSPSLQFNFNMYNGVFGWMNYHRLPVVLYMSIFINSVGTMGFVRAMEYFDSIVLAVATLMEPLLASFIAVACHAGLLPGALGWVGNVLVVGGTLTVIAPSAGKEGGGGAH
eukprot:scaffold858_cov123-Cylindrotheca_fusiformis.AAC.30